MGKSCPGDPGHPPPRVKFTAHLHGKKLRRAPGSKLALSVGRLGRVAKIVKNVNMVDLRIVQSLIAVISSLTAAL